MELGWEAEVVFNSVGGPEDLGVLTADDGLHQLDLDIEWQGGGEAIDVDFIGANALRFEEDLVALLICEPHNLVFDRRAVSWSNALDNPGVERGLVQIGLDDVGRCLGGISDVAWQLASDTLKD